MRRRLKKLLSAIGDASTVLILPHSDPDPDAIAGAVALRYLLTEKLGVAAHIGYEGIIGRAENKALVEYLGNPLYRLANLELPATVAIALVDTQPGAGNNALPPQATAHVVIDHHAWGEATAKAVFADVRPEVGSTSTMVLQYLRAARLDPPVQLATALYYGVRTDTMRLGWNVSPADMEAYLYLQPHIDVEALVDIEGAQVPAEYFKSFVAVLGAARVYDHVVVSYIGEMSYPDLAAEMADLLLRLEGVHWVVCMGVYQGDLILAVRARGRTGAGQLVKRIVDGYGPAGGHNTIAGGRVPLNSQMAEQYVQLFTDRALDHLEVDPAVEGMPLL